MMFRNSSSRESGVILVELAIVIPVLLFICFLGYDMARATSYDLALKDISRELAVSAQLCAYMEQQPRERCIREHITNIDSISRQNFPGGKGQGVSPIKLSFEAYELTRGETDAEQIVNRKNRQNACGGIYDDGLVKALSLNKLVGYQTGNFNSLQIHLQSSSGTVGDLLKDNDAHQELVCLNRTLIVAEVEFFYSPILTFKFFNGGDYNTGGQSSGSGFFSERHLNSVTVL